MRSSSLLSFAKVRPGILASHVMVGTGLTGLLRHLNGHRASVFTFHGLRDAGIAPSGLLDEQQHPPAALFNDFCRHLRRHYNVVSLSELTTKASTELPQRSVALTFDDGYASNYDLAWPILKAYGLPATIFVTTGYLDGSLLPWFVRLETALIHTAKSQVVADQICFPLRHLVERRICYSALCQTYKRLPQTAAEAMVDSVLEQLQVEGLAQRLPTALRPMTWSQAKEMQQSGTGIEIGGHTHSHPVLGRCDEATSRHEIFSCAERLRTELGELPAHFAYPNGLEGDFTQETISLLNAAGFKASFTMMPSQIVETSSAFELPRYGSPESVTLLEMAASGGLAALDATKRQLKRLRILSRLNS